MMITFGQKVVVISSVIVFIWLCIGIFMFKRYFHLIREDIKFLTPKSSEQELFECKTKNQKLSHGFWQRINLQRQMIPESLIKSLPEINVHPHSVTIQGIKVHYLYANPKESKGIYVLLLHGQSFTSETWNVIGTIRMLAAFGYHPIAVDLPGYGESPKIPELKKANYLDKLIYRLNVTKPILISPSMSGSFSMRYLVEHPEKLGGFIAVAPVGTNILNQSTCTDEESNDIYLNEDCRKVMHYLKSNELKLNCIKVPTMVVWGEFDRSESSARLCLLPESQGVEIPKGKHPAYLSNPDLWHKLLYNFLNFLKESEICR